MIPTDVFRRDLETFRRVAAAMSPAQRTAVRMEFLRHLVLAMIHDRAHAAEMYAALDEHNHAAPGAGVHFCRGA